jgi:hypothetical protein
MTHKFAIVVERDFFYNIQNNPDFYLRIMVLDVIRALVNEKESVEKYSNEIFVNCAKKIENEIKIFEDETSVILYLELSDSYLDEFFEKPLDDPE